MRQDRLPDDSVGVYLVEGQRHILARGFWLVTERRGSVVRRRPAWWTPPLLSQVLLKQLVARAECFARYMCVAEIHLEGDGRHTIAVQCLVPDAVPLGLMRRCEALQDSLRTHLALLWSGAIRCWQEEGWLPDVGGRVYLPWELYDPFCSHNVVVDTVGRCYLVDAGCTALFHCRRSPLARIHAAIMCWSLRRHIRRLGGNE